MKNSFLILIMIAISILFSHCNKENYIDISPPSSDEFADWVEKSKIDVNSLKHIVKAVEEEEYLEKVNLEDEKMTFHLTDGSSFDVLLDNANYPSPLIGAHLVDGQYYWTVINGTGTSSIRLVKAKDRSNYKVIDQNVPRLQVNNSGNWAVEMAGNAEDIFNADGLPYKAIGRKSLFNSVSFDIDSNATIYTNESSDKYYTIQRYRPFTVLLDRSETDTLKVASGFTVPIDFRQVGIDHIEFDLPNSWSADYELNHSNKSGILKITSPIGFEPNFDERGAIIITSVDQYNRKLIRKIPVKVEVGLVNYANVTFTEVASGVDIVSAKFIFAESNTSKNIKEVTSIKAEDSYRLMLPDGYPNLRKVEFTTSSSETFDYYFEPNTYLSIGDQNISIKPPTLLSYWQGGMIVHINETSPLIGVAKYKISGKVVHVNSPLDNLTWFPNGNINVTGAMSDTDGKSNTTAIINALGGVGTSANSITRWAIRVQDGGYSDWYLGAIRDYEYFHESWTPNNDNALILINKIIEDLGGNIKLKNTHNLFWTSTNISATHAKTYDVRQTIPYTSGQKIYGARGLAFRDFD